MLGERWNYMSKIILQDIKLNTNKVQPPVVKEITPVVNLSNPLPKIDTKPNIEISSSDNPSINQNQNIEKAIVNNSSKYDFLKKRNSIYSSNKRISDTPQLPHNNKKPLVSKTILFIFILTLLVGIFYLFSTVFFKAKVTVIPKNKVFSIEGEKFRAAKNKEIPFEVMIVDDSEIKNVVLTSSKEVSEKAKGEITLYNEFSNKPQKIASGSFISDDKGKSYKIDSTINIPGYTMNDSKIVPGEVVTAITSFLPGEAYNGSPDAFYINSFKGTDKYKKIYGKIKSPLAGGVVGLVYVVDVAEKDKVLSNVSTTKDKLFKKLNAQVPVGYLLYPDAVNYSYEIDESVVSKTPDAKLNVKGTLSAILLKKTELSSSMIDRLLPDVSKKERSEILEPDLSSLVFNFVNKTQVITKEMEDFEFELKGNVPLNWKPETEDLKKALIGKNKNEIPDIFKQDPGISSASVSIIPFWSKKLPNALNKIDIILK